MPSDLNSFLADMSKGHSESESCLSDGAKNILDLDSAQFPPLSLPEGTSVFVSPLKFDWESLSARFNAGACRFGSPANFLENFPKL